MCVGRDSFLPELSGAKDEFTRQFPRNTAEDFRGYWNTAEAALERANSKLGYIEQHQVLNGCYEDSAKKRSDN